ncbi:MAG TPA: hypothetical protein VLJ39_22125 [Tepidisphaeraceae bacterium]|nr:hypothetical protein [Tepidisphaeraceae bacterium]
MKNMRIKSLAAVVVSMGMLVACQTRAAEPITPEQFEALRAEIPPAAGEQKWTQIPWLTSLWDARRQAAAQGKPILLWEMDGHPLGCV